jgi:cell division protein FtsB
MAAANLRKKVTRRLISRLVEHEHGFKRKTVRLAIYFSILYLVYLFCAGDYGLFRIYRLTNERNALNEDFRAIVSEAADYSYRLRRLNNDSHYVEWLARSRYGFSRPDETIYHLKLPLR